MEQVVILVFIGLVSLVNWLIKRSADLREKRKQEESRTGIPEGNPWLSPQENNSPETLRPRPAADPAAGMRKLMEALGIPPEDQPPVVAHAPEPKREPSLPPLPAFEKAMRAPRTGVPD